MRHQLLYSALSAVVVTSCSSSKSDDAKPPSTAMLALATLPNSSFEIDEDANLKLDAAAPYLDWGVVGEMRQVDAVSGSSDDAFGKGSKEDTPVPTPVDGGIPPNKSDLKTLGVYLEKNGDERLLHMFWHRVQDPSGTTNMDFEFNQSPMMSANGVTAERLPGDLLIQYDLSNGGSNPELFLSRWIDGSEGGTAADCEASAKLPCWSAKMNLSIEGAATGSINSSMIPAAESDGLGEVSPRTFGEASVDFNALVPGEDACVTFGSAYLKSRSSDSFTSAVKDFIAPLSVNISNCGAVEVHKLDDATPPMGLTGASFSLVADASPIGGTPGAEDTAVTASCVTVGGSCSCSMTDVLQGEYWLIETAPPTHHDLASPAYQHVTVTADTTASLSFINPRHRGAILITKTRKHAAQGPGDHPHAGVTFIVNGMQKATNDAGQTCFDGLLLGDYLVQEVAPDGYAGEPDKMVTVDNKAACNDTPYVGETVMFHNTPLSNIAVSFSSQVPGGTVAKISCDGLSATPPDATPSLFDDSSKSFVNLKPGTYNCTVVIDP